MKISIDIKKVVSFLFCGLCGAFSLAAQDAEIISAMRYLDILQPGKAVETMKQAVSTYPENYKLYYYLGYVYLETGDKSQAISSFEKGLSLDDKEAINYVGLGAIRMAEGKPDEAKAFFDEALSLSKSKDPKVLQAIAEAIMVDASSAGEALKYLEKAKDRNRSDPRTFMLIGKAHFLQNMGGVAITAYENAASLDPSNAKPWYNIAMVYQRAQNVRLTEQYLKKAIATDAEFTLAYKELGELYYSMKDGEKAASAYETYLRLKENPTEQDKTRYAFFVFMSKDYAKANEIFAPLAAKPEATSTTIKYYGYSLVKAGDLAKAQEMFDRYFSLVPEDKIESSDYNYYAELLQYLKRDSLAVVYYKKSLALTQGQPEIAQTVAIILFDLKKYNDAIAAYQELFKLKETPSSDDYYKLGQAYYFTEQYENANSIFTKFVALQPDFSVSYLWLGRTRAVLDPDARLDSAKAAYDKVVEISSKDSTVSRSKAYLIEAYRYLAFYSSQRDKLDLVKSYMQKILAIDPNDQQANAFFKALKAQK